MRVDECILEVDKRILSVKSTVYCAESCFYSGMLRRLHTGVRGIPSTAKLFFFIEQCARCRIEVFGETPGKVFRVVEAYLVSDFRDVHAFVLPVFQ